MSQPLTLEFEVEEFRAWTERAIKHLSTEASARFLKAIAFEFLARVIDKTPVDTGRARAGWTSYLLAHGQPIPGGKPKAVAEGVARSAYVENLTGKTQFIALINAVHYVVLLEYGSSRQAPGGMMRVTFRELQRHGVLSEQLAIQIQKTVEQANRTTRRPHLPG